MNLMIQNSVEYIDDKGFINQLLKNLIFFYSIGMPFNGKETCSRSKSISLDFKGIQSYSKSIHLSGKRRLLAGKRIHLYPSSYMTTKNYVLLAAESYQLRCYCYRLPSEDSMNDAEISRNAGED